ncbi:hypothetical protein D0Z08_30115 [Nocardioides immobilis]|uniref:Novel STAND NTPase 1 domain-containing protein n=1 Tax=Nocardioides immobilis TaxID=2049295 RepID=A0A417XSC6_9ACTN|nr:hypothetical protein D0Z08_30115 [Nocardioides immobilis]
MRVNVPPPRGGHVVNRYVYSVASRLFGQRPDLMTPTDLGTLSLTETVHQALTAPTGTRPVLVLDQFEEVLTLDPADWSGQEEFFVQLGHMLDETQVWVLLSMREDYMGGLHRYNRLLPGQLRARYRLDFLTRDAAARAIQEPAARQAVEVTDDAANAIVSKLADDVLQQAGLSTDDHRAPYVEPVQLQVVCRQLWQTVRTEKGDFFPTIERSDVDRHVDVEGALRSYYDRTMGKVARKTGIDERLLRDWVETKLIVGQRLRGQTTEPPSREDPEPTRILRELEDAYLIRGDTRAQATWYELSHDRLIEPVLEGNHAWRVSNLPWWKVAAHLWRMTGSDVLLLKSADLRQLGRDATDGLTETEVAFLEKSRKESEHEQKMAYAMARAQHYAARYAVLWVIIMAEAVVILALVAL